MLPDSKGRKVSVNLTDRLLAFQIKPSLLQLVLHFSYFFLLPLGLPLSILSTCVRLITAEKETQHIHTYFMYEQNDYYTHIQF